MMFHTFSMAKRQQPRQMMQRRRIFLKEWREYRGLTQVELGEKVGMSESNISQLERGLQGYSERLEDLAAALDTEPGFLLSINPLDENSILSLWARALPAERDNVMQTLRMMIGNRLAVSH